MEKGRFAPSPSGRMHLGNLMCSLLAWLSARASGGQVVLRIEDLDAARCPRTYADLLEQDRLFANDGETAWMCLNCGQIIHAAMAPRECPICRHGYGYFVRLDMAPWVRK